MDKHSQFLRRAIQLAVDNVRSGRGGPFGAIVVKDDLIIGEGANSVTAANDPTAHAEVVAIRNACQSLSSFQLDGCDLYTSCEPCPMCMGAIYWARPLKVYFGNTHADAAKVGFDDSFIYDQLRLAVFEREIPLIPFMREEALAAFEEWQKKTDRINY